MADDDNKFMGTVTDMGSPHAEGMGHDEKEHQEEKKKVGFGGSFDFMAKDAKGVGDGK